MVAIVEDDPPVTFYIRMTNGLEVRGTLPVSQFRLLRSPDDLTKSVSTVGAEDVAVVLPAAGVEIYNFTFDE